MFSSIFANGTTVVSFAICMVAAVVFGILNALVFTFKSKHTSSFALTLALLPMAVAMVIMLVNGNIGAGIAVAGAFALVRFRSVPGNGRDIAAIFVSMALGLAVGMGYIGIACVFFVFVTVVTMGLTAINFGENQEKVKQLKILIPENYDYQGLFDEVFAKYTKSVKLDKVKTANMGTLFELTYIVEFRDETVPKAFFDELRTRNGNLNIAVSNVEEMLSL